MRLIKAFGILVVVLATAAGFAFPSVPDKEMGTDVSETFLAEFSESDPYISDSSLASPVNLQQPRLLRDLPEDFRFRSFRENRLTANYLQLLVSIDPGLDVPEIIFPYHSFL